MREWMQKSGSFVTQRDALGLAWASAVKVRSEGIPSEMSRVGRKSCAGAVKKPLKTKTKLRLSRPRHPRFQRHRILRQAAASPLPLFGGAAMG